MKPVLSIAAVAALGFCACQSSTSPTGSAAQQPAATQPAVPLHDIAADARVMDISLKPYQLPEQHISIPADKPRTVTGAKGTVVQLDPADLETADGSPVGKNIDLTLIELTDRYEMLRSNAQTESGGRMLVSGGAYYIGCSTDGHEMRLRPGRKLAVSFPKKAKEEMALFYGKRDSAGNMNWQPSATVLKTSSRADSVTETVAVYRNRDSVTNADAFEQKNAYGVHIVNGEARLMKPEKTTVTDTAYVTRTISVGRRLDEQLYAQVTTDKMGWINCDRFYNLPQPADMLVSLPEAYRGKMVRIFFVFKNMNSVLARQFYAGEAGDEPMRVDRLPVNEPVRIVAFTVAGGLKGFSTDMTLKATNTITLNMEPVTDVTIKKLMQLPARG